MRNTLAKSSRVLGVLPPLASMATAILSSVSRLIQNLDTTWYSIKDEVNELKELLSSIQTAVDQAEERQWRDEHVRSWLMDLKDAACDAEDVLEELLLFQRKTSSSTQQEVYNSFATQSCRIQVVRSRLRDLLVQTQGLHLKLSERVDLLRGRAWTSCDNNPSNETRVFGREEDKENVIRLLLSETREDSPVIAIVGPGGVGKTTLLRLVYNDQRVLDHFPQRGWIRMSKDFGVLTLKREVMESFTLWDHRVEFSGKGHWIFQQPNYLENYFKRKLEEERFLLVLDDFCEENLDVWESINLQSVLSHKKSKIILVTRSERDTGAPENMHLYRVSSLPEDVSWQLFQSVAFGNPNHTIDPDLVKLGREIVQKCKGVPLSLKMLGVSLQSETREKIWNATLNSDLWDVDEKENDILPALRLSYYFLAPHLQPCFAFCCLFPTDFLYKKDRLVRLWMAQGFIHLREGKTLEEVGAECFDELVRRSFFVNSQLGSENFVVHHRMHDLAEYVSGRQSCKQKNLKVSSVSEHARHLSLITQDTLMDVSLDLECETRPLRSILLMIKSVNSAFKKSWGWHDYRGEVLHLSFTDTMFENLKFLRTLDLSDTDIRYLPDSVCNLKFLRFLSLNNTRIRWLPEALCSLHNLQTLELQNLYLTALPRRIGCLTNLRHIDVLHSNDHIHLHNGIGKLTNLQTLSIFYVGNDLEHYVLQELDSLRNLTGELCITGLHNVNDAVDAIAAGLKNKEHLEKLILQWCDPNDYCHYRGLAPNPTGMNCINCQKHNAHAALQFSESEQKIVSPCREETEEMQGDDMWLFQIDVDMDNAIGQKRTGEERIMQIRKVKESQEMTMENLYPHENLKHLVIKNYYGSKLSSWMGDPAFSKLVSIELDFCPNCDVLPAMGQLPLLMHLKLRYFSSLKRVGREFCGTALGSKAFLSLKTLEFDGMYEWEEWCGVQEGDFPSLSSLRIFGCRKLERIPGSLTRLL